MNNNVIHIPFHIEPDYNCGLAEKIWGTLQKCGDTVAQIDTATGRKETYAEFLKRTIQLAQAMQHKGIKPNDTVAFICFNNMDYAVIVAATIFIGARYTPIDVTATKPVIFHCLKLTEPKLIFYDTHVEDIMESALAELDFKFDVISFDENKKFVSFSKFIETFQSKDDFKIYTNAKGTDTVCIAYTSGTSGLSKGALITNFSLYAVSLSVESSILGNEKHNIMIFTLPYWITNVAFTVVSLLNGLTRVIYQKFDIKTFLKTTQDYQVTATLLNQLMINNLINNPEYCKYDTSRVKCIMYAGSNIGMTQINELSKIFPSSRFLNCYGMTEIAGILFQPKNFDDCQGSSENQNLSHTVGTPHPGFFYKVVDVEAGKNLPPNQKGELCLKYKGMLNGYIKNPEATKEAFDKDGYFKTGDLVYYNENNYFYYVDRLKEIFKYKGFHISPTIIEDELLAHPEVLDVAVIGIPEIPFGELPTAVIVLKHNVKITEEEIKEYIKNRLPDNYQLRGGVKFIDEIPKTASGKIKRNILRELILKERSN